jgi:hypothetical protein
MSTDTTWDSTVLADLVLHSPDGLAWADCITFDPAAQTVTISAKGRALMTMKVGGPVEPGNTLSVQFDIGFQVKVS